MLPGRELGLTLEKDRAGIVRAGAKRLVEVLDGAARSGTEATRSTTGVIVPPSPTRLVELPFGEITRNSPDRAIAGTTLFALRTGAGSGFTGTLLAAGRNGPGNGGCARKNGLP